MGYGSRPDLSSGKKINLDKVYMEIIKPVVVECGYECIRGDEVFDSGLIDESMYYGILESDLVIADLTTLNPNAIYELGVRHGVKRYHTVIMMETSDQFFFDLNHIRTITYTYHKKKELFDTEAKQIRDRLKKVILNIEAIEQIDSPLYKFVNDLQEPQRRELKAAMPKALKPIFERIKEATDLKKKEKYKEAFALFEELAKDIPSDPFFKQQMALCTYKQDLPSTIESLEKAYRILEPISETIDPETNGLIGAIYKRRFGITNQPDDIDRAIVAYRKAYNIYADNYTGENYSFCLLLKAASCADKTESEELKIIAKHTYREIFDKYKDFVEEEVNTEYEVWVMASLAASSLVLDKKDMHEKYEGIFFAKADQMMKSSYKEQKDKLIELLKVLF